MTIIGSVALVAVTACGSSGDFDLIADDIGTVEDAVRGGGNHPPVFDASGVSLRFRQKLEQYQSAGNIMF